MAETLFSRDQDQSERVKRKDSESVEVERPHKRLKALLDEDDTSAEGDSSSSNVEGVLVQENRVAPIDHGFTVNQEFARRFEHNKKREELQRC